MSARPRASQPASPGELAAAFEGALASLDDQMAVLQILDGTAENWPGIAACMLAVRTVAQSVVSRMLADSAKALGTTSKNQALAQELDVVATRERAQSQAHQRLQKQAGASAAELRRARSRLQEVEQDLENDRATSSQQVRASGCW